MHNGWPFVVRGYLHRYDSKLGRTGEPKLDFPCNTVNRGRSLDVRRRTLFGTITIQLQLEEDGSIAMSYILSGESTATKVRHSRLSQETVAADVASVLAKAVPLLTPQRSMSPLQGAAPTVPAGFRDVDELAPDLRSQAFRAVRRMVNAG